MDESVGILEVLSLKLGCNFISDLHLESYIGLAKNYISHMDLSCYSASRISDLYQYLGIEDEQKMPDQH